MKIQVEDGKIKNSVLVRVKHKRPARVVFGKWLAEGEERLLHPDQAAQLGEMYPGNFEALGDDGWETLRNGQGTAPEQAELLEPVTPEEQVEPEKQEAALEPAAPEEAMSKFPVVELSAFLILDDDEVKRVDNIERAGKPAAGRRTGKKQRA